MKNLLTLLLLTLCLNTYAADEYSVAGFFPIQGEGRQVWNFNNGWRFLRGDANGAEAITFDDSRWEVVSAPHTAQLMPAEASGCRNYQGIVWYRKHFVAPKAGDELILHFEAIMGKQKFYVNGKLVKEHEGGYLPVNINLTDAGVRAGEKCLVAVMADNSDDKTYPPGKKQMTLDFCYHGGMYRDVWLIAKSAISITDAVEANETAGGGIFVHYADITEKSASVYVNTELSNKSAKTQSVKVENGLKDKDGKVVKVWQKSIVVPANGKVTAKTGGKIANPKLWSPETPYLYNIETRVVSGKKTLDAVSQHVGIRSFEFRGKDGFWLNGKRYHQFVGGNHHQDFAYVGNAMPNSQQWRDVKRLKELGFNIIRTAHYPQDPAFMDACDELGIFIIVATPGWQYWNKDVTFAEKVHQNTREIIRRDRNHPCVLMWEPILNETRYPEAFALEALKITRDEYPYPYHPVAAADIHSAGVLGNYEVLYAWPGDDEDAALVGKIDSLYHGTGVGLMTREFGEYVDDWYAHNNLNRASRSWGEIPQLKQALSLSNTTCDQHRTTGLFLGGCQWHPFDHQRGYHPDPYWGGAYDAFRQAKYSKEMFHSQIPAEPFVYIAHEMTQFSPEDVTVFSNCDSVRISRFDGEKSWILPVEHHKVLRDQGSKEVETLEGKLTNDNEWAYNAPVIFPDVWDFWAARELSYKQKAWQKVNLIAEGIKDGKVVCTTKRMPSRRSTKLRLYADTMNRNLVADGSDFVVVVCEVTDDSGNVRRLAKDEIVFSIEGEGVLVGDNPRQVEWGSAPIILRSTTKAGKIKIHASVQFEGTHAPTSADLEIESVAYDMPFCHETNLSSSSVQPSNPNLNNHFHQDGKGGAKVSEDEKKRMLQEVQDQQADFGVGN